METVVNKTKRTVRSLGINILVEDDGQQTNCIVKN